MSIGGLQGGLESIMSKPGLMLSHALEMCI